MTTVHEDITLGEVHRLATRTEARVDNLSAQIATQLAAEWQSRKDERHAFRGEMTAITTRIEVSQQELRTDLTAKVSSIITRLDMFQQFGGKSISLVATVVAMAVSSIITGIVVYRLTH